MNRIRLALLAAALLAFSPAFAQTGKFDRSYPFAGDKDIKVGIKVGDVTIDSFRIRHWPDSDDFHKAEKDLKDTHTMVVEFHYSNRDRDKDYKCKYVVTIPGGRDGKPFGENDRTATLDKGKLDDTNMMFVKMVHERLQGRKDDQDQLRHLEEVAPQAQAQVRRPRLALLGAPFRAAAAIVLVGLAREDAAIVVLEALDLSRDLVGAPRAVGRGSIAAKGSQFRLSHFDSCPQDSRLVKFYGRFHDPLVHLFPPPGATLQVRRRKQPEKVSESTKRSPEADPGNVGGPY